MARILSSAPNDAAIQCLDQIAAIAGIKVGQDITRATPRDAALTWKAAAVHPLQVLETEYQGIVHDAVRGIDNLDRRKLVEGKALGEFFFFDSGTPRLLGVGEGEPYCGEEFPFLEDKLRAVRKLLKQADQILQPVAGVQPDGNELRRILGNAYHLTLKVRAAFLKLPGSQHWHVAAIDAATAALQGVEDEIQVTNRVDVFQAIIRRIDTAREQLAAAVTGLGSVQMFYVIESFYLYRLLVRYRLESPRGLSDEAIAEASGALTDLVTNGHPWLSDWLRDKIVELGSRIQRADPSGNTLFFLKGGRAIRYLENRPEQGKNDWDTQIVINPELPAEAWYEIFLRVSNAVLIALKEFNAELYMLLHHNAAQFAQEIAHHPVPMDLDPPSPSQLFDVVIDRMEIDEIDDAMEIDEPADLAPERYKANCKAELIDVGLPRYDTVEAREQWHHLRSEILHAGDGIPYPGHFYYIAEYLLMIREVFAGKSPSLRKAPARIERLYGILQLQNVEMMVFERLGERVSRILPEALRHVMQVGDVPTRCILLVLLADFIKAYGLDKDPGFAHALDRALREDLPRRGEFVQWTPALLEAIGNAELGPGPVAMAEAIGFGQWFSDRVEAHLRERGEFVARQRGLLDNFLRAFFANAFFDPREELELQAAVRGSYAAWLQGDYSRSPRIADLDPPGYFSLGIYCARDDADRDTILDTIGPIVEEALQDVMGAFDTVIDREAGTIRIYWEDPQNIPPFIDQNAYAPLAIEIVVMPAPARPLLSYVWGLATLSLRDLIKEYRNEAAEIEEYGRRIRLRDTAGALTEIMTRAANPEPRNRAIEVMRRGFGHHLMISSDSLAIGPGGAYPGSYYPDMAYEVLLTANREALRRELTLPPANPGVDRSLDLLVINQGHGGIGTFDHWSAGELYHNLVEPLLHSGVRAHIIVLDFCLSSSLIDAFAPLCAPGGMIVSNVYSIAEVLMTTEVWSEIRGDLAMRNIGAIQEAIGRRARVVSANVTGLSHIHDVRTWSEQVTAQYLAARPFDFDAISITRYLPQIAAALEDPGAAPAQVFADLLQVRASPNLGLNEQAVLVGLPHAIGLMTPAIVLQLTAQLRNRLIMILTQPQYGLGMDVAQMPLFGPHSLWHFVHENRLRLLALAQGLRRCPTPFTLFAAANKSLSIDAAIAAPVYIPQVTELLEQIEPHAPGEIQQILSHLFHHRHVANLTEFVNYLQ